MRLVLIFYVIVVRRFHRISKLERMQWPGYPGDWVDPILRRFS